MKSITHRLIKCTLWMLVIMNVVIWVTILSGPTSPPAPPPPFNLTMGV